MSLKEEIDYIKKEISTEESIMESFFKLEKFYKKYKATLFGTVSIVVIAVVGYYASGYIAQQNRIEVNEAFNKVLIDPNDKASLSVLKEKNQKLYEIAQYSQGKNDNVNSEFLKELSLYSKAIEENSIDKISQVTQKQTFLLKDFALFNKAVLEAKSGKYTDAKESLKLIPKTSNIAQLTQMLEHFLLTK